MQYLPVHVLVGTERNLEAVLGRAVELVTLGALALARPRVV